MTIHPDVIITAACLTAEREALRTPCGELIALYNNGLIVSDGTVPKVIEEIRAALIAKEPEPEYTREEMREACRNNFGRQLDAALPNADAHNDLAAQVAQLRADMAAMGNALADYFDNGSDYSTGAKVRAIAERQGAKNG